MELGIMASCVGQKLYNKILMRKLVYLVMTTILENHFFWMKQIL